MKYDVFLCYNSKNKADAKFLYQLLCRSNFDVFFDETDILPGQDFQSRLESGIRESAAIIVLVGPGGLGPWQELENRAYQIVSVKHDRPIIPVLLPGSEASFHSDQTPAWLQLKSYVAFETALDGPNFVRLASAIPKSVRQVGQVERPFLETEQEALLRSTIGYYEQNAETYITAWENDLPKAPMFSFLSQIERRRRSTDPPRILDAGCGPGHHARFFAKLGCAVTGIDRCARFIDYASSRSDGSGCTFIHGDMRRLDAHFRTRNCFDGVWACASCLHLARESLSGQLYQFAALLRPNGVLGLSFQVGMPSGMKGPRFYERYDESDLQNIVQTHGFRIEDNVAQVSTKATEGPQIKSWVNLITVAPEDKASLTIPHDLPESATS